MIVVASNPAYNYNPKNFLYYLNYFEYLIPSLTPGTAAYGSYDIPFYLSTFEYVITTPKVDPLSDIQIMQTAYLYNPNMKFYAYIDGSQIVDTSPNTPFEQLELLINNIIFKYNVQTNQPIIQGIYIDNFEFLNVGAGYTSKQTFRDAQIYALMLTSQNDLSLAVSCPGKYNDNLLGKGGYKYLTNLPYILNIAYDTSHVNPYLQLGSNFTIVDYTLYGYDFFNSSSWTGYSLKQDFFNNVMLLNSILTNPFNSSCKFSMAITTRNANDYRSSTFFNNDLQVGGTGIANIFYNVATLLNADSVATSSNSDFYKNSTPDLNMINVVFPFSSINYYPRSKMYTATQDKVAFQSNPAINITIDGNNTSYLMINGFDTVGSRFLWI